MSAHEGSKLLRWRTRFEKNELPDAGASIPGVSNGFLEAGEESERAASRGWKGVTEAPRREGNDSIRKISLTYHRGIQLVYRRRETVTRLARHIQPSSGASISQLIHYRRANESTSFRNCSRGKLNGASMRPGTSRGGRGGANQFKPFFGGHQTIEQAFPPRR